MSSSPPKSSWLTRVYEQIVRVLQRADHGKGAVHFQRGRKYQDLGQDRRAVQLFSLAVQEDPAFVSAWVLRGISRQRLNRYESAMSDFSRALELDPAEEVAWFNRGLVCLQLGDRWAAIEDFSEALTLNHSYTSARANRAIAYLQLEEAALAFSDFDQAIETLPDHADLYLGRGMAALELDQWEAALQDFSQAIALDPLHHKARLYRAHVLVLLGNPGKAEQEFARIADHFLDSAAFFFFRGELFRKQAAWLAAEQDFQRALDLDPENLAEVEGMMAFLFAQQAEEEAFFGYLEQALEHGFPLWESPYWEDEALIPYREKPEFMELLELFQQK